MDENFKWIDYGLWKEYQQWFGWNLNNENMQEYRIPELNEFVLGFEYEYRSTRYELSDDSPVAIVTPVDVWVKCKVEDVSGFGDIDTSVLVSMYNRDKTMFRVKVND